MLAGTVVPEFLGQSVINEEKFVTVSANSHEEIIWFNVSVDEVLIMDEFDPTDHLVGKHQHRFHGESPWTEIEQILQRGTQ